MGRPEFLPTCSRLINCYLVSSFPPGFLFLSLRLMAVLSFRLRSWRWGPMMISSFGLRPLVISMSLSPVMPVSTLVKTALLSLTRKTPLIGFLSFGFSYPGDGDAAVLAGSLVQFAYVSASA